MHYRYILTGIFCLLLFETEAQTDNTFRQTDSVSFVLYQQGKWRDLMDLGKKSISEGTDFPYLQLRMGYAAFMLGNYNEASDHYKQVLLNDSYNQTARYYLFLCQKYLNRTMAASYEASYLDPQTQQKEKLTKSGVTEVSLETSIKVPDISFRGTGIYTRVGLSNRLGWKWQLDQSVVYFSQTLSSLSSVPGPGSGGPGSGRITRSGDKQFEYYVKFNYIPSDHWAAFGAYHFMNHNLNGQVYQNHIGVLGLKYFGAYFDLQADADLGQIEGGNTNQYNLQLGIYPLGNLNFYVMGRGSYLEQAGIQTSLVSALTGFKITRNLWLEGSVTIGGLDNFLEREGLYVYNSIDISKSKGGGSLLFALNPKTILQLHYTHETKIENLQSTLYNQHSITGGITWKF